MKGSSTPSSPPPIPSLGFVPGCPSFRLTFFTEGSWNRILKLRPCPYYPIRSGGVELPPVSQPRSFRDSRPKRTSLHSSGCKRTPRYPSRVSSSMTLIRVVTRATSGLSWDILIKTPVNYPSRAGRLLPLQPAVHLRETASPQSQRPPVSVRQEVHRGC